jgi:hypothetical protein
LEESPQEEREQALLGARLNWEVPRACGWLRLKERETKQAWVVEAESGAR